MKSQSFSKIVDYLKLIRVTHWIKNLFVFVPIVFSKHLFDSSYLVNVLNGFIGFSLAASFVYVLNDTIDADKDLLHPVKKMRPVASGRVSKTSAAIVFTILFLALLLVSFTYPGQFVLIIWTYVVINIAYSFYLKNVVIIDIFCIAAGFILRVVAGAVIASIYISNWLILTTIFISIFLGVIKRRVEIANSVNPDEQRSVLKDYSLQFIDQIVGIAGGAVILCYALYTVAERTVNEFGTENLVFTTLFVIFGIFRYMFIVYKRNMGENIIEVLLTDFPMLLNSILFIISILLIIYR